MCGICVLGVLFSAGTVHVLNAMQVAVLSAHVQCIYVIYIRRMSWRCTGALGAWACTYALCAWGNVARPDAACAEVTVPMLHVHVHVLHMLLALVSRLHVHVLHVQRGLLLCCCCCRVCAGAVTVMCMLHVLVQCVLICGICWGFACIRRCCTY